MIRRVVVCLLAALLAGLWPPSRTSAAHSSGVLAGDVAGTCGDSIRSGATQVVVCPLVVQSGHTLRVIVHSRHEAAATLQIVYQDGTSASQLGTTDNRGAITFSVVVRYAPVARYATASFQVSVNKPGGSPDVVQGVVRIAQAAPNGKARLQARPDGAPDWCADGSPCPVRNNSTIDLRVISADPGSQVMISLLYPDGQTASCLTNALNGASTVSAEGEYDCTLAVSLSASSHAWRTASVQVVATITTDSSTRTLQKRLWLASS